MKFWLLFLGSAQPLPTALQRSMGQMQRTNFTVYVKYVYVTDKVSSSKAFFHNKVLVKDDYITIIGNRIRICSVHAKTREHMTLACVLHALAGCITTLLADVVLHPSASLSHMLHIKW